ncbi:exopolyphosphatase PRUNE1 isoform X2 [Agrilus planipennis]|nr:exopolyphosphatase PRUNE1 isoform X2 [Agrilus planipennis]
MKIHVVMGNESCDLDSMVSTLALSYYLYKKVYDPNKVIVVPLLNINSEELSWRTENCFVLKKIQLDKENLIYRNNIDLEEIQTKKTLSVSLVDHHVLKPEDLFLAKSVRQIFDHRPKDSAANWDLDTVRFVLKEVGSCATLVAEEIIRSDPSILVANLATLLYDTITFDTIAYNVEAGKVKELDLWVASYLEEKFKFQKTRKALFDELWYAHNNVSHLTPKQLLYKDLKIVECVLVPGLPMLVQNYLKMNNAISELPRFCEQRKGQIVMLVGLQYAENKVKRDLAVYPNDDALGKLILKCLNRAIDYCGYSLDLKEVSVNAPKVTCMKQENIKISRKQILPIIREAILIYRQEK